MGAGLTSAVNINPELQRRSHHPFMSSGNWLNNSSFPFYKADKIHRGHCHRHGLRHSFPTGFRPAQLPAEHCLGSQVSTAAAQLERKGGESAEDLERSKERKQREEGSSLPFVPHSIPCQHRVGIIFWPRCQHWGWRDPHSPTKGSGVEFSLEMWFTLSSLNRHLFQKN